MFQSQVARMPYVHMRVLNSGVPNGVLESSSDKYGNLVFDLDKSLSASTNTESAIKSICNSSMLKNYQPEIYKFTGESDFIRFFHKLLNRVATVSITKTKPIFTISNSVESFSSNETNDFKQLYRYLTLAVPEIFFFRLTNSVENENTTKMHILLKSLFAYSYMAERSLIVFRNGLNFRIKVNPSKVSNTNQVQICLSYSVILLFMNNKLSIPFDKFNILVTNYFPQSQLSTGPTLSAHQEFYIPSLLKKYEHGNLNINFKSLERFFQIEDPQISKILLAYIYRLSEYPEISSLIALKAPDYLKDT